MAFLTDFTSGLKSATKFIAKPDEKKTQEFLRTAQEKLKTYEQPKENKIINYDLTKAKEIVSKVTQPYVNLATTATRKVLDSKPKTFEESVPKNYAQLPKEAQDQMKAAYDKYKNEQRVLNKKEILKQADASYLENSYDPYKEFAANKVKQQNTKYNVGLLKPIEIGKPVSERIITEDFNKQLADEMSKPETAKEFNRIISANYVRNFLHESEEIITSQIEALTGQKFDTTKEVKQRISEGLKRGLTLGIAGERFETPVEIGGEEVKIPDRLVNISPDTAAAIDFTSELVGSMPTYAVMAAGVEKALLSTGKNMVNFAYKYPLTFNMGFLGGGR